MTPPAIPELEGAAEYNRLIRRAFPPYGDQAPTAAGRSTHQASTVSGTLRPVLDAQGQLLPGLAVVRYRCPGCRGLWLAPVRQAARWQCGCGATVQITIDPSEWRRLEEDARKRGPIMPWEHAQRSPELRGGRRA